MRLLVLLLFLIAFEVNDYEFDFSVYEKKHVADKKVDAIIHKVVNPSHEELDEIECLALNLYKEARGEPQIGILAVAHVTLNRVKSSKFPSSVCDVVYQKNRRACQFSWVCMKKIRLKRPNEITYERLKKIAEHVYFNKDKITDVTNGALYYHAEYVKPLWRKKLNKTKKIGKHIFYKE